MSDNFTRYTIDVRADGTCILWRETVLDGARLMFAAPMMEFYVRRARTDTARSDAVYGRLTNIVVNEAIKHGVPATAVRRVTHSGKRKSGAPKPDADGNQQKTLL